MAVAVHVLIPGISQEQYDQVRAEAGWLEHPPEGGILHVTWWEARTATTMDAWESEAAFEAFGRDLLGPAMAKVGVDVPIETTFHPAHEVYAPQPVKLM